MGGDVVLLNEKNLDNVKTPDFLWHDRHWDLKDVSSVKEVDNAVRKGLHQIKDNPSGLILNFGKMDISVNEVKKIVECRLRRGFPSSVDIILISREILVTVFRYKKREHPLANMGKGLLSSIIYHITKILSILLLTNQYL